MNIEETLIKFNDSALPNNFVSIAVQIFEQEATHAALLIRHNDINYLHHFPGNDPPLVVDNFNEHGWYIYKVLEIIKVDDANEVGSFLQYCKRICQKSKITYSYISDGSKHNFKGEFESKEGLPEFGTCVSFCVNTLTNFIIDAESYFHLDDWDDSELRPKVDAWATEQASLKYPDLDWAKYNAFKKRIKPIDFLCSAFFTNSYPIKKEHIKTIEAQVNGVIQNKFVKTQAVEPKIKNTEI